MDLTVEIETVAIKWYDVYKLLLSVPHHLGSSVVLYLSYSILEIIRLYTSYVFAKIIYCIQNYCTDHDKYWLRSCGNYSY